jgi:hypothetical protein
MRVDISSERILSLNEAAILLGRRVSYSTWWRWSRSGIRGHKLTLTRVGGRTAVALSHLESFLAAINGECAAPARSSTKQRQASIARAKKTLARDGVIRK